MLFQAFHRVIIYMSVKLKFTFIAGWEVNRPDMVRPRHFSMDLDQRLGSM